MERERVCRPKEINICIVDHGGIMKLTRISFLFLLVSLCVPYVASAQSSATKSWSAFWAQFSSAVRTKNRALVKNLMAYESEFSPGGGNTGRDDWLDMLGDSNMWKDVQRSVAKGVVNYSNGGKPGRIMRDRNLIFQYLHAKWRFVGVMGD